MRTFIIGRLLSFIPVVFGVVTITFLLMRLLPGDPAAVMLSKSGASAAEIARLRAQLGLDKPILVQYANYLGNVAHLDFGSSIWTHRPVLTVILEQLPHTIVLAVSSLLIAVVAGTILGVVASVYQNSWIDRLSVAISVIGVSVPMFWSGLIAILIFAATLHWLPAVGEGDLRHLVLPASVLGLACVGAITRIVRSSMVEVLQQEYVTTARGKGLGERAVIGRHALRNALIPTVTQVGLQFGWLLGGSVIVETVFSRQGIGQLVVNAVLHQDYPLVQGVVLFTAMMYLTLNLIIDLVYCLIDPRIRLQ